MSNLSMTQAEEKSIDSKVEQMMDWAKSRQIEAEQLALDSARLIACATDRLDRLSKQGFYRRCWSRFNGEAGAMERANVNDVIQMQKMAFRYVNMLQEQQLLMAHSLLSLKNNLNSLAVKEEETRNLIAMLAQRTLERFEQLESRVGKLETSSNLHDWLFTLEERDYEEKIPTDYMRLLRVINDFYEIKNDNWNNNDLMFMRKAIRTVGLNPKQKLSINAFIDKLADEIQSSEVGFDAYDKAITMFAPDGIDNYSQFAIDNISSPVFASLHGLNTQYRDKMDAVEALQDSLSISASDALKTLLRQSIKGMNVNLDYEFPLAETAIEVLGCMRLTERLTQPAQQEKRNAQPEVISESSTKEEIFVSLLSASDAVELFDEIVRKLDEIDDKELVYNSFVNFPSKHHQKGCLGKNGLAILNKFGVNNGKCEFALVSDGNIGFILEDIDKSDVPNFIIFDAEKRAYGRIQQSDLAGMEEWDDKYVTETFEKFGTIMELIEERLGENSGSDIGADSKKLPAAPEKQSGELNAHTLGLSQWLRAEHPDYSLQSIVYFKDSWFVASASGISKSGDLGEWELVCEIEGSDNKLFKLGPKLVCISDYPTIIKTSSDGVKWVDAQIPRYTSAVGVDALKRNLAAMFNPSLSEDEEKKDLTYRNMCRNGNIDLYLADFEAKYFYTKKGFFRDTQEIGSYHRGYTVVEKAGQISSDTFNFKEGCFNMCVASGGGYFGLAYSAGDNKLPVYISKDGIKWVGMESTLGLHYERIFSARDFILCGGGGSELYQIDTGNNKIKQLDIAASVRRAFYPGWYFPFSELNLYLVHEYGNNPLYATNDFQRWEQYKIPSEDIESIAIGDGKLAFISGKYGDNHIYYS